MLKSGGNMRKFRVYGHEKKKDYTQGPMLGKIILFMLPVMFTGIIQLLYNAADMVVVGNWADNADAAVAAVGACGALINLIVNLFMGLSVGAGVAVAQKIGAGDHEGVHKVVHTAILTSVFTGIAVGVFGFCMAKPLLVLMGTQEEVLVEAAPYMRAYFVGIPASMVYNYAASILRSKGDSKNPLIFLTLSGLANVFLNLIFVSVFHMGAVGVGIATAVAQYIAMFMVLHHMANLDDDCKLVFSKLCMDKAAFKKMLRIGLPAGLQATFFSLSNTLIQSTVNTYPTVVQTGNTTAGTIEGFVSISMNACYHAALTFTGQNVGAKKWSRLNRVLLCCVAIVLSIGLTMGFAVFFFGEPLLSIYAPGEPEVVEWGMIRLTYLATTYFLCGIMEVGCGMLRGIGQSFTSMVISLTGTCALRVLWIYTVFAMNPTMETLYLSYPVSWTITLLVEFVCYIIFKNKLIRYVNARDEAARAQSEQPVEAGA